MRDDPFAQMHGRSGQKQQGIDVYGTHKGRRIGVQCKGKNAGHSAALTDKELRAEVNKAKAFKPALDASIVVTTAPNDMKRQEVARLLTEEHRTLGLFEVHVHGWDTLRQHIAADQKVFRDHFPDLVPSDLEAQPAALDSNNQTGFSTLSAHYVVLAGEVTVLTGEGRQCWVSGTSCACRPARHGRWRTTTARPPTCCWPCRCRRSPDAGTWCGCIVLDAAPAIKRHSSVKREDAMPVGQAYGCLPQAGAAPGMAGRDPALGAVAAGGQAAGPWLTRLARAQRASAALLPPFMGLPVHLRPCRPAPARTGTNPLQAAVLRRRAVGSGRPRCPGLSRPSHAGAGRGGRGRPHAPRRCGRGSRCRKRSGWQGPSCEARPS